MKESLSNNGRMLLTLLVIVLFLYGKVYPDDIAPPKYIPRKYISEDENDHSKTDGGKEGEAAASNKSEDSGKGGNEVEKPKKKKTSKKKEKIEQIEIMQKSLALCLVRCRNVQSKRIGVELLEASIYDLNPQNMRRAYQFGSYRYDPGERYTSKNHLADQGMGGDMLQRRMSVNNGMGNVERERRRIYGKKKDGSDMIVTKNRSDATTSNNNSDENDDDKGYADVEDYVKDGEEAQPTNVTEKTVIAVEEDEVDAPWNQYAWIEEMQLRVSSFFTYKTYSHIPPSISYLHPKLSFLISQTDLK